MEVNKIYNGDCLEVMKSFEDNCIDSIVTDPPYGLSFMGKKWDYDVPSVEVWQECMRVLKPGGYLLSFAGSRTYHRMAVNIEDAGFEIRDQIMWVYGSGFPKSHNISKSIDKKNNTYIKGELSPNSRISGESPSGCYGEGVQTKTIDKPQSKEAKQLEGWGTALKPAHEPIVVARKPLSEKTVAANVLKWGTGGINIDECRVETQDNTGRPSGTDPGMWAGKKQMVSETNSLGRFPANFIHDGSDEVVSEFPDKVEGKDNFKRGASSIFGSQADGSGYNGQSKSNWGSASRFFYCAKASKSERNEGLEGFDIKEAVVKEFRPTLRDEDNNWETPIQETPYGGANRAGNTQNNHPTVKPVKLMQYLVRLVTPKGGVVLDPFIGSGTTGKACRLEGFDYVGIEKEEEYCKIAEARINNIKIQNSLV